MLSAKRILGGALAAASLAFAAPALAGVVVKSSGPSAAQFPAGKKLDDNDRITLKEGDEVTILTSRGTRILKGAGTYRVGARGAKTRLRLAELTRQRSATARRTGAARTSVGEAIAPSLWYVDVTRPGRYCIADFSNVTLWRPTSEGEQVFVLKPEGSEYHIHVTFGDGVMARPLDDERLPIREGARYRLSGPDGTEPREVTFVSIDAPADDAERLAEQLIEKGCSAQLDVLAKKLAVSE